MDAMAQWDKGFPPLNLWNYNRHWAWIWEWDKDKLVKEWAANKAIDQAVGDKSSRSK